MNWFLLSATQRHPAGQYNLGRVYYYGLGIKKNYKEAVKWWRLSAEQQCEQAQIDLALLHDDSLDCLISSN